MFEVKPYRAIVQDLHKIVDNYTVLFDDGDNPVLYTGTNPYGNRLIGVIMFEDDDNNYLRYMHVLVTDGQYIDFINKRVTLRSILQTNFSLFIVDKKHDGTELTANIVPFDEIPNEFLPLENSYCPDFIANASLGYAVSLKGNKADLHLAEPEDLNSANIHIASFIRSATEFFNDINLTRKIYVEALSVGSFKINFKIEVAQRQQNLFQVPIENVSAFLNEYFIYVLEKLPKEDINVFKNNEVGSESFLNLEELFNDLYNLAGARPSAGVEHRLIDNISYAVENLKNIDYSKSFNRLEFINYNSSGGENPIGLIDENYISSVSNKFFKIETLEDRIEYDAEPKEYNIQVYQLNKETGNGAAYLEIDGGIHKILLHLKGKNNYQNTIFTHNMDEMEPKLMQIKGIGKRVNGVVTQITFTYEQ